MANEKKEKMGVIGDLKLDINNLKLQVQSKWKRKKDSSRIRQEHITISKGANSVEDGNNDIAIAVCNTIHRTHKVIDV